jgi:glyoxylase-like metal-dependent hydrolase (beta-lactamase superfamily II)
MRLTEKVYLIGGGAYGYSAFEDCNLYLVNCDEELAIIDTGAGGGIPRVIENIRMTGFNPESLKVAFVTHCHYDHIGGNYELKNTTGCKIAAHNAEVEALETLNELSLYSMALDKGLEFEPAEIDIILSDGQNFRVGDTDFKIIHTPGHTPGGICLLIREKGVTSIFTGDTASAQGKLGWINGPGFNLPKWKNSIKQLLNLKPERIFPGHGAFVISGAVEHLKLLDEKMNSPWINIVTSVG